MVAAGTFLCRKAYRLPLRSWSLNGGATDCVGLWRNRSQQTEHLHLLRECKLPQRLYSLAAGDSRFFSTFTTLHRSPTADSSSFNNRGRNLILTTDTVSNHRKESELIYGIRTTSRSCYSTSTSNSDDDSDEKNSDTEVSDGGDFIAQKRDPQPHGVDPRRGWGFRGVHKAIICGSVGQAPMQKILRNGRTVTILTVGTGGLYDQRHSNSTDLPKPAQWHRVAIHSEHLGTYAVQQLTKNSSVYVEGDIETRVYNDSISGEVKNVPEICVRHDGRIRLVKSGESINKISIDELREGLFQ
ncbi:single-stranded DNA-binding protein, mitochondrial-like [Impatiens glandulifera]|uniref:single-stranded DNA-binding protein, mitochondrial-like n=1 Tax=Impatiens glandulifera TaxID=253017 RepID=UPI001FB1519B|nr:single-stranded DNA-binding protein, mitochondrial-like [Impatiens glandulifera]